MGSRGPVPKRDAERRRRNKDSKAEQHQPEGDKARQPVKVPRASSHWHPIAKAWFKSLSESGQSDFYEPSDWQAARYVAELISRHLKNKKGPSAQLFTGIWAAMTDLLTTEGSRRRAHLEIERERGGDEPETPPAGVTALDDYRRDLGVG